jgi:16S rRNA processing protein RimM
VTKDREDTVSSSALGSDAMTFPSEPRFLVVGRVLRPHGVRGEVRVEIHTDFAERFAVYRTLYLGDQHTPYGLEGHRFHQGTVLLKFRGLDDRNAVEALRGQWVRIAAQDAVPLQEGEIYLDQMLHLQVVTVEGEHLGSVIDIIETGANPVYVVRGSSGEILIPDTDEVILNVDLERQVVTVHLIEGLR